MSEDLEQRVSFIERMMHRKWGQRWECCDCHDQFLMEVKEPAGHYSWYRGRNESTGHKEICLKCLDRREAEMASFKSGRQHDIPIRVEPRGGDESGR